MRIALLAFLLGLAVLGTALPTTTAADCIGASLELGKDCYGYWSSNSEDFCIGHHYTSPGENGPTSRCAGLY